MKLHREKARYHIKPVQGSRASWVLDEVPQQPEEYDYVYVNTEPRGQRGTFQDLLSDYEDAERASSFIEQEKRPESPITKEVFLLSKKSQSQGQEHVISQGSGHKNHCERDFSLSLCPVPRLMQH